MSQNNIKFENSLNIHLFSSNLPENVIKDDEDIRVSITTVPEGQKQHFSLDNSKKSCVDHIFSVNITNNTTKIIMVFRKKMIFTDSPIIASASIHIKDFKEVPQKQLTSGMICTDIKKLDLYFPLQQQMKEMIKNGQEIKKHMERKIIGQMKIQLTFSAAYIDLGKDCFVDCKDNNKIHKIEKNKKKTEYEKLITEDNFCNPYLLQN